MIPAHEIHGGEEFSFWIYMPEELIGRLSGPYRASDVTIETLEVGNYSDGCPISFDYGKSFGGPVRRF